MKSFKCFILFCFLFQNISCQVNRLDSLNKIFLTATSDTSKCRALLLMMEYEMSTADANAFNRTQQLAKFCENKLNSKDTTNSYYYQLFLLDALNSAGFLMQRGPSPEKGLEYYQRCVKIALKLNDTKYLPTIYNNIAYVYDNQSNNQLALNYYFKSLALHEKYNNQVGIAYTLINIAGVHKKNEDTKSALIYYEKSLMIMRNLKNNAGIINALNNIGALYLKKNTAEALKYFKEALYMSKKSKVIDGIGLPITYYWLGQTYLKENNLDLALTYLNNAKEEFGKVKDLRGIAESYSYIGEVYWRKKNLKEALDNAKKAIHLAEEIGIPTTIYKPALLLYKISKENNNPKEALKYYELFIKLKDSISNQESRNATIKSQLKHEYELKSAADSIKMLEDKKLNAVKLTQEQTQKKYLYVGIGLIAVFGLFMFNRYRVTQKQKRIIEDQKILVEKQKILVDEKQREVIDSIKYARRIQQALLPSNKYIKNKLQ